MTSWFRQGACLPQAALQITLLLVLPTIIRTCTCAACMQCLARARAPACRYLARQTPRCLMTLYPVRLQRTL